MTGSVQTVTLDCSTDVCYVGAKSDDPKCIGVVIATVDPEILRTRAVRIEDTSPAFFIGFDSTHSAHRFLEATKGACRAMDSMRADSELKALKEREAKTNDHPGA